VVVSHLVQRDTPVQVMGDNFTVSGPLCQRRAKLATPFKFVVFRVLLLTIGRFSANLTRSLLQKILITGKPRTPYAFTRTIRFEADRVEVEDRFPASMPVRRLMIGADATSIYVANSNVYQESVLCPWQEADPAKLPIDGDQRVWKRTYFRGSGHDPGARVGTAEVSR